ncbi:Dolichol-phosphate mannosyltransferase subunit 3 [Amanita muscaria]|uniref:Dolichol-phosphate mannosyltransferase subunit 3 n=1 Tax=Amanita muscaria (strain Koide BX008) TaxID=946122 RepID=A0A0C2XPY8_AMAMK|nr:hypothetical protein M378DRAFT_65364 [Amanita muscaria Koide BX008]
MARAHRVGVVFGISTVLYFLALFQVISMPFIDNRAAQEVLPLLPWWLLVSFGSFSLWSLGWGLCTFRDCNEAYVELLGEISEAKNDLRARGVSVD